MLKRKSSWLRWWLDLDIAARLTVQGMQTRPTRLRHYAFVALSIATASVFLSTVATHVYAMDFMPLASLSLPVLAVFFTFTSLLYIRGNTIAAGRSKVRTLFAAEISMQATVCYLTGIVAGASLYGLFQIADFSFDSSQPTWSGLWLLLFALPSALMLLGLISLLRAACLISPQFLTIASPYEIGRRIQRPRAAA
ncbi:hypothetical protein FN976_17020 [Caenimonas sedimenti]|uniref:DUF2975 domain-containing protein n=1 Tax=Caenimonas sedimenti TaxID=2596921 RepID=A0A562ZN73_9BURK|nr:hypothetical protein [Caenimonas sedimenti]TWO70042.1 hypothetical protein FN976_17020 [Caenimonas sedimenti]